MTSGLESFVNRSVSIITADGRNFIGTLKGFDQSVNLVVEESHERVFSAGAPAAQVVLGLHLIRGDNVAVVGQLDEAQDARVDLNTLRADPLPPVVF
ncbi:U6 snRNA-associated Sm-like protein LSm8 [Arctopsyche grandis]|uniref:U6 snRNA-associated Sm-like protein LSm8 n=1 Tax=Arctopsyche grandis TaxID=121162 RepID=UPI00406D97A0